MDLRRTGSSGLSLLLGGTASATGRLMHVPLTHIRRNEQQPREYFDQDAIASLATSIASQGVIQPVVVREAGPDRFELIAGERRWLAAQRAGLETIPAVVHDATDRDALVLGVVENVVREDLTPIETAKSYGRLIDEFGISISELAHALGKSRPAVSNTLRILELPDPVLEMLQDGTLTEGHGRALLQAPDRHVQVRLAVVARDQGMTVRELERRAREHALPRPKHAEPAADADFDELADRTRDLFAGLGVRAEARSRGGACAVTLRCVDPAALNDLLDTLEAALIARS